MALATYNYPGNVRELENIIEHAVVLSENGCIRLEDLPDELSLAPMQRKTDLLLPAKSSIAVNANLPEINSTQTNLSAETPKALEYNAASEFLTLDELEKQHILRALDLFKGNKTEVAEKLGISRATLWRKLKDHKIEI